MASLKVGARLRSAVCSAEVIVVKAPDRDVEVSCGGSPMLAADEEPPAGAALTDTDEPALLGKRYVNEADNLELLCTKAGEGSLAAGGERLMLKDAKPLPSSD